jgi:hypothetical protein
MTSESAVGGKSPVGSIITEDEQNCTCTLILQTH